MHPLNSSVQIPTRKISWWKEAAGIEPVSQGVQKTASDIPESWAREGRVLKALS